MTQSTQPEQVRAMKQGPRPNKPHHSAFVGHLRVSAKSKSKSKRYVEFPTRWSNTDAPPEKWKPLKDGAMNTLRCRGRSFTITSTAIVEVMGRAHEFGPWVSLGKVDGIRRFDEHLCDLQITTHQTVNVAVYFGD